ncbi:MAG TPA: NADH-quinone oxidoreductase subunit M [Thiolinea sp.]|nr:NADH-quinone oxidoreductase subunit M [Thiolinea sp.]
MSPDPTLVPLSSAGFPWLTLLLLLLPLGAAITAFMPKREARWTALTTSLAAFLITLVIVAGFQPDQPGFQFVERSPWMPTLNAWYFLGLDGISLLFLPCVTLLFSAAMVASWNAIRRLPALYFALLLVLETAAIGVFCALDTLLFLLFWELALLPLYFLISLWGQGAQRRYAAMKHTLYMLLGGIPVLLAFILLALQHPDGLTFDYLQLLEIGHRHEWQQLVFFLLLGGFAVKLALFPVHSWLPVVALEGPAAVVATLVGLKLGAYGLIRFALPLAPGATQEYQWLLNGLGMFSLLYGALAALGQGNLRRMLAFSSISHVGLVVLGVGSFNEQGIQGAVFQLLNFSVIAGGLFLILGFIHQRIGSCDMLSLGGLSTSMPLLSGLFLLLGLASLGLPGTSGFPAELLLILGVMDENTGAGLLVLTSMVLSAAYFLILFRKAFWGPVRHEAVQDATDLLVHEKLVLTVFTLAVLVFGFYPQAVLEVLGPAANGWLERVLMFE